MWRGHVSYQCPESAARQRQSGNCEYRNSENYDVSNVFEAACELFDIPSSHIPVLRRTAMFVKSALCILSIVTCIGCDSSSDASGFPISPAVLLDAASASGSPLDAGDGFVFGLAEIYSNNPLGIVDVAHFGQGETPRLDLLHNGSAYLPYRHASGAVTVTESCHSNDGFGIVEYRQISVLTTDGGTSALTPCSDQIESPSGFTWIEAGKLSPNGQRLVAQLFTSGAPPISAVFEGGREIARYSGFGLPGWIDDDTLLLVGSKLVTARLGEDPIIISDQVTGFSLGHVAVSPDGSQLVFEWQQGLWILNVDGSGLRELLPANHYVYPTWSPDGRWVASIQRQAPSAVDAQLVASGAVGIYYQYTNLQQLAVVNVETGEQRIADLSIYLNGSQMPQGGLSWY